MLGEGDKVFEKGQIPEVPGFWNMADYVKKVIGGDVIESVIDFGTGPKGVVAMSYWDRVKKIKRGYACDIWKIKKLPPHWTPLLMDALEVFNVLEPKSVDVVQAFGFLEHLTKKDGYIFLKIAEKLAKKFIIISAAACLHSIDSGMIPGYDPDYKVKLDGNVNHRYNSIWHWREFEALGYTSNIEDAIKGITFRLESIAWKLL